MSETDRLLSELLLYVRTTAAAAVRPTAGNILDTYEKALIYSKLDGRTTQAKLETLSGVPQRTISDWLEAFVRTGLVSNPNAAYTSHKALYSLDELGINISILKRKRVSPPQQGSTNSTVPAGNDSSPSETGRTT